MLAMVIAGTSAPTAANTLVLVLCFLLLPIAYDRERSIAYGRGVALLLLGIGALFVVQLAPMRWPFGVPAEEATRLALTADWGRTFGALLFAGAIAALFTVLGRFSENDLNRVLPFFFLGYLLNIVVALVQFTASGKLPIGFLPYVPGAGFFANQNHFGALLFAGIPFVIYQAVVVRRPGFLLFALPFLVFVGFATRSVAGAFLTLGCAMVGFALIAPLRGRVRAALLVAALIGGIVLAFNPGNVLEIRPDDPLDRTQIWRNTIAGVSSHLPWGTGLGTFDLVYPQFEAAADIRAVYVNTAHNEYLQLLLEAGIPGGLLMIGYLLLLARQFTRPLPPLKMAALCSAGFLLIHSVVEYPLRTPTMALVFVFINAVIFSERVVPRTTGDSDKKQNLRSAGRSDIGRPID